MQDNKKKTASDSGRTITIIISIVIALLLWSYVIIQVNPTKKETIPRVPVQLLNEDTLTARQLAIFGDSEYLVDVIVEGQKMDIGKISSNDITAEADLAGWSKGENYIPVNVKLPPGLKLVEIRSSKIQVTIEDLVTLSKPIQVVYRGDFPRSMEEEEEELRPAEIVVTGAKSAVESVHEVRVYIDAEALTQDGVTVQGEAMPLNDQEMIVENVRLSSNYVDVSARLLYLKEVPLVVETAGSPAEGYGAEINAPQTILIKGARAAVNAVESVSVEPISLSGMTKGGNVTLTPVLPEGITLSKQNPRITATVNIEEIATKVFQFTADDILLEGLTQGKTVNTDAADISVSVTGRKQIIDQLQRDQLKLYIEVTDLLAGSQIVSVMVSADVTLHSITVEPPELAITIIDAEQEDVDE